MPYRDRATTIQLMLRKIRQVSRYRSVEIDLALAPGEVVRVVGLSSACQGTQRRRLLDLGVVRGTEIEAELVAAAGDPVAYRVRGALIALRREQASWIAIERIRPAREEVA